MSEEKKDRHLELTGGDAFSNLMERPEKMIDNAVAAMTKKAAASVFYDFKMFLACATEPFFRKNMGERYFSSDNLSRGVTGWILASFVAWWLPSFCCAGRFILPLFGLNALAAESQIRWIAVLIGGLVAITFYRYGAESLAAMKKYRAEGLAYHTQSRGIKRWGDKTGFIAIAIFVVLLLFDLPAGLLFLLSILTSTKLAAEQQAAIYSRYLDVLDQRIENEYLENAMLGKCPTEITQLAEPISDKLKPELRENIAAAAVGKPVQILGSGKNRAATPVNRAASQPTNPVTVSQPVAPDDSGPATAKSRATQTASEPKHKISPVLLITVIALLAVAGGAFVKFHAWLGKPVNSPAQIVSQPVDPQPAQQTVAPVPAPPLVKQAVAVENTNPAPPPIAEPIAEVIPVTPTPADKEAALAALAAKRNEEERQTLALDCQNTIDQIRSTITAKTNEIAQILASINARLDGNATNITKLSASVRKKFSKENDDFRSEMEKMVFDQAATLTNTQNEIAIAATNSQADLESIKNELSQFAQNLEGTRQGIFITLDQFDADISKAPKHHGFLFSQ